jgi:hypothetical protein
MKPISWGKILRGGQHCAAQRQAENVHSRSEAGGGYGAGRADYVRSGFDHAGAGKLPDMQIHLSVQANAVNWATVKFWQQMGLSRSFFPANCRWMKSAKSAARCRRWN